MMKFPKWALISAVIVGVFAGAGTGLYLWQRAGASKAKPASIAPATVQEEVATWTDPAGFTFQYPKALAVDKHEEDQDNYAHVELTSKDHPGGIIVWAKDTTATDVNAWVKTEKQFAGATVSDATMSGKTAKTIVLADASKTIAGTIDEDILFMVETVPTDTPYWSRIHDMIVQSFTLTVPQPETGTSADTSAAEEVVDEEEILE